MEGSIAPAVDREVGQLWLGTTANPRIRAAATVQRDHALCRDPSSVPATMGFTQVVLRGGRPVHHWAAFSFESLHALASCSASQRRTSDLRQTRRRPSLKLF